MSDVGRPSHNEYNRLGYEQVEVKVGEKLTKQAQCFKCNQLISNTAIRRLQLHRNRCGQVNLTSLRSDSSDTASSSSNTVDGELLEKRKAQRSLGGVLSSLDSDSDYASNRSVVKKPKKDGKLMSSFIDEISPQSRLLIEEALLKFCIGLDIDFQKLDSKCFHNFIRQIRPAFEKMIPTPEYLIKDVLPSTHAKLCGELNVHSSGILFVMQQKYQEKLISLTYGAVDQKFMFVRCQNTGESHQSFITNSINSVLTKFSTDIYAVIDNSSLLDPKKVETANGKTYYHLPCLSRKLQDLIQAIVDPDMIKKVCNVNEEFDIPSFKDQYDLQVVKLEESDSSTYYDGLSSFLQNVDKMKGLLGNDVYVGNPDCIGTLYDINFINEVKKTVDCLKSVNGILEQRDNLSYTQADFVEDFLKLMKSPKFEKHATAFEAQKWFILNDAAIIANYLNPKYRGKRMEEDSDVSEKLGLFLLDTFDEDTTESFHEYEDGYGLFELLKNKNYEKPSVFWRQADRKHHKLSVFAISMTSIPAFTSSLNVVPFTNGCNASERINEITSIFYSLQFND